jgi:hypothetical protein
VLPELRKRGLRRLWEGGVHLIMGLNIYPDWVRVKHGSWPITGAQIDAE